MDCPGYKRTWGGDRRRCSRQVWRVWRDQESAFEPWPPHWLCEGTSYSISSHTICLTHGASFFIPHSLFQGYALVEYETMTEAQAAIDGASGTPLLEQVIQCDYAFVRPPPSGPKKGRPARGRSASPSRRRWLRSRICWTTVAYIYFFCFDVRIVQSPVTCQKNKI